MGSYTPPVTGMTEEQIAKLDGIESNATADQAGAEIKTAYEGEANAYTDAKNTKLGGISTGADVTGDNTPKSHTVASHSGTTATGAELETLTDGSETALHSHVGAGASLNTTVTQVKDGRSPETPTWTDLDLSGVVGSNSALVFLKISTNSGSAGYKIAVRRNGDTGQYLSAGLDDIHGVACSGVFNSNNYVVLAVVTDSSGIIEYYENKGYINVYMWVIAYIK